MLVALLFRALEYHFFGESIDRHREHQADERAQANFVRRWDHKVKRHRPLVVHEVIDCEITRRGVFRYEWIAVECERGFRGGKDSAEVAVLFVRASPAPSPELPDG